MRPDQIESMRYKSKYHCSIELEEKLMFEMLDKYTAKEQNKNSVSVLDIGCGSGLITKEISNLGFKVKGLDFSEEAIKKASNLSLDTQFCDLDEGICEESTKYNVVWAGDIIEHVFDPINLLKESCRVLKKEGIILMTIPNDVGLITRLKTFFGISYQSQMYKSVGYFKHHTFFTLDLIKFMLEKTGFKIVETRKILNLGKKRILVNHVPSFLYNELVIKAEKR